MEVDNVLDGGQDRPWGMGNFGELSRPLKSIVIESLLRCTLQKINNGIT